MYFVMIATTSFLFLLTVLPFVPSNHWIFRVWEFPRVQISVLMVLNIIMASFYLPTAYAAVCIVITSGLLSYQGFWVLPFTGLCRTQVESIEPTNDMHRLTIITSNVLMLNKSSDKLLRLVDQYDPDILVTLETNSWWQTALEPMHSAYPHRVAKPLDNLYGMHVYSKYKLSDVNVVDLVKEDIPSVHCNVHLSDKIKVKCHFLHPEPPSPTESKTATPRDKELLLVAKMVDPKNVPTIVTGDLNDVAWSPTTRAFRLESGLFDPRLGRGFFNTFHAQYALVRWPLDHIFHSEHLKLVEIKRLSSIDSDHFPLYSSFAVER